MTHFFLNHFFALESTKISYFCILLCFSVNFLSTIFYKISSDAFNCLHLFFSVFHLFKNRSEPPNPLTLFAIRGTSKPGFPQKTKSLDDIKSVSSLSLGRKLWHFVLYFGGRKGFYIVSKERRRVIKLCPRRAHRCGELSRKMTLCVLTRQTLKGRSLGLRSRNNVSFRYRRFKSKISSIHWHLSTKG